MVEIHTKTTEAIKVSKVLLRFNDNTLNQEIAGDFSLSKATPIVMERELYISKENFSVQREFIKLLEVIIEVAGEEEKSNCLQFVMLPYLKPLEDLLDLTSSQGSRPVRRPVRAKEPIVFNIEPMPSKVKFTFEVDENRDQALVGDFY